MSLTLVYAEEIQQSTDNEKINWIRYIFITTLIDQNWIRKAISEMISNIKYPSFLIYKSKIYIEIYTLYKTATERHCHAY